MSAASKLDVGHLVAATIVVVVVVSAPSAIVVVVVVVVVCSGSTVVVYKQTQHSVSNFRTGAAWIPELVAHAELY